MNRFIVLICFGILYTGCEEIFHPEEISIGKIESPEELESAVNGVYGRLASAFTENWEGKAFYSVNIKGDDLANKYSDYSSYYNGGCNTTIPDEEIVDAWSFLYSTIIAANNIIIQYDPSAFHNTSIGNILGEAYLIRAYCYFRLTRTYGQIPLIDDIEIDYNTPISTFQKIYEFIEHDLKTAIQALPTNNNQARYPSVTPHRGTAKAILSEVYLSWAGYPIKDNSKYSLAAREAIEVIDSSAFFGFALTDDFAGLWDEEHYYNQESILCLYFSDPQYTAILNEINTTYNGHTRDMSGEFLIHPDSSWLDILFPPAELNFYNKFPVGYRKNLTFYSTIFVPGTGYISIQSVEGCNRIAYRKFFYNYHKIPFSYLPEDFDLKYLLGNNKIYLFRYAQTLLTYAEAAARSGQLDEKAYECMNKIRRRANNVDIHFSSVYDLQSGLLPEAFADSVVWERAWELAGEPEGRWFDLVRLELVENLSQWRHPQEGGPPFAPITKEDYFTPIPEEDQLLNPNLNDK